MMYSFPEIVGCMSGVLQSGRLSLTMDQYVPELKKLVTLLVSTFSNHTDHRRRCKLVSRFVLLHTQIQDENIIIARTGTEE